MLRHIDHIERERVFRSAPHGTLLYPPGVWLFDTEQTEVVLTVTTLYLKRVDLRFRIEPGGSAAVDESGCLDHVDLAIDTASLDSGSARRDRRLMGPDFLDVKNHPTTEYTGSATTALIGGVLRAKGVDSCISTTATSASLLDDHTISYSAHGTMSRESMGLCARSRALIGREVRIRMRGRATRAPAEQKTES